MGDRSAEYAAWIAEHVPANPTGLCRGVTQAMVAAFPELRRVRGHYHDPWSGQTHTHWWCVAPDGQVVDPTAAQFPSRGAGSYVEHPEGAPEPTGRCHNCGEYAYGGRPFCSDACAAEVIAELNGARARREVEDC